MNKKTSINDLKKTIAEQEIKINQLKNVIESIPCDVYWKSTDGIYLGCNSQQAKKLDMEHGSEIIGKSDKDLNWGTNSAETIIKNDNQVIKGGLPTIIDEHVELNGKKLILLSHKAPLKDGDGNIYGIVGVSFDITKTREKESQILSENEKAKITFETILSLMPGHVYWLDSNNTYLGCNEQQAKNAGLKSASEIIGKRNKDLIWKDQADIVDSINNEVMLSGKSKEYEEYAENIDGKRYFLSKKVPLKDSTGKAIGLVGVSFDVTERKHYQEQIELALKKAEYAENIKGSFLSIMTHELKNTIIDIVNSVQLCKFLLEKPNDKTIGNLTDYLHIIEKTSQNILPSIEDVITYLELEKGNIYTKPSISNPIETIRAVLKNHQINKSPSVRILLDISDSIPDLIEFDNFNLFKILDVVVFNAVRFTEEGSILLNVSIRNSYLYISVKDTGKGMSKSQLESLFEPFPNFSIKEPLFQKFGLRLSIAKKIIHLIGGDLTIDSELGNGTIATISIPVYFKESDLTQSPDAIIDYPCNEVTHEKPLSILLVEDDAISLAIELEIISEFGHKVDYATSGSEAIEKALHKSYDLIFMDISLPDISGIEATKIIREKLGKIPVIAITSYSYESVIDNLLSNGIESIIPKPVTKESMKEFFNTYTINLKKI